MESWRITPTSRQCLRGRCAVRYRLLARPAPAPKAEGFPCPEPDGRSNAPRPVYMTHGFARNSGQSRRGSSRGGDHAMHQPAVHQQSIPAHIARRVAGEEADGLRDLVGACVLLFGVLLFFGLVFFVGFVVGFWGFVFAG